MRLLLGSDIDFGSIHPTGDINGDGLVDLSVGAPAEAAGGSNRGQAYLYFGGIDVSGNCASYPCTLNGSSDPEVTISGAVDSDQLGKKTF